MTSMNIKAPLGLLATLLIGGILVLVGCKDDFVSPPLPTGSTVLSVAESNADLDIMVAALNKTNQAASLNNNNSGMFTLFAPSDSAWIVYFKARLAGKYGTEDSVLMYIASMTTSSTVTIAQLNGIVTYSILQSNLPSSNIVGGGQVFSTLHGSRLSISKNGSVIMLNANTAGTGAGAGAKLQTPDLTASNGVIHMINRALQPITAAGDASVAAKMNITVNYGVNPPTATVSATGTNFNIMANALASTGLAFVINPNQSPLPDYTVIAPSDAKFQQYITDNFDPTVTTEALAITWVKSLSATTDPTLEEFADLVAGHVLAGRLVSTDFANQVTATLSETRSLTLNASPVSVTDDGGTDINVTTKDIMTNAGIIHVIDGVADDL